MAEPATAAGRRATALAAHDAAVVPVPTPGHHLSTPYGITRDTHYTKTPATKHQ